MAFKIAYKIQVSSQAKVCFQLQGYLQEIICPKWPECHRVIIINTALYYLGTAVLNEVLKLDHIAY